MSVKILGLAVLSVILLCATVQSDSSARVVCYFSSWAVYRPDEGSYSINDIPGNLCTHVIYAFVGLTKDTHKMLVFDYEMEIANSGFRNFTSLRSKFPNAKFMVSFGGWGDSNSGKYSDMVSQNSSRADFLKSVVYFLSDFGFDGLELDWEYPGATDRNGTPQDKDNFMYLVQELRQAFDEAGKNWELTANIPLVESRLTDGYHIPELCSVLNAVHISAYDLRGYWDGFVDVQCPLYGRPDDLPDYKDANLNSGLTLLENLGCPANKLVVGIPFYGRTYTMNKNSDSYEVGATINVTAGGGEPGRYTNERGALAYYEICTAVDAEGSTWTKGWAEYGMCPYAYTDTQWIGYENSSSLEKKMNWIKEKGYLGAMAWSIDMDDFRGLCGPTHPLLKVVYSHMSDYTVPAPKSGTTTST